MPDRGLSAAALRERFDRAFASAPQASADEAALPCIGVHAHGHPFALALREVSALHVDRRIVPLPTLASAPPSLLGLAALHGALTPIYDLGRALGALPDDARDERLGAGASPWRWLVVAREAGEPLVRVGFAFASFDVHLRPRARDLVPAPSAGDSPFITRALAMNGTAWPLVDLGALCASLKGPSLR